MKRTGDIVIKVLSLGIGLAAGIVLIAKVFFELSYDSFYKDIDRVYSIRTWYSMNGDEKDYGQVSGGVATGFMKEVPGVEVGTRTTFYFNSPTFLDEDGNKLTGNSVLADSCFFKIFDRPILAGDPVKTLGDWGCVMVSRSFAEKLLRGGSRDLSSVIGRQIANEDLADFRMTVEGVFEDFPKNGTLNYDVLLSMETYPKESTDNWNGNDRYMGYVKLLDGVDPGSLTDAIRKMQEAHQPLEELEQNGMQLRYFLSPYSTIHTSAPEVKNQVILLSIVAALLIIISLLNYILIVISSMVSRSREVGIRKCYGAEGKHIYGLLAKEASLHIFLALALAAALIFAGRGIIENLLGVPFTTLLVPQSILAIAVVILLVLTISIIVPAELYQRIPVYQALKSYRENSRGWKIGLLGVQVLVNVFLVVMMLVIGRQYRMVSHADTGYDYKNLYYISLFDGDRQAQERAFQALRALPEVNGVAAAYNLPYQGSNGDNIYLPGDDRELFNIADQYECSPEFYDLMGIQFLSGRAPQNADEMAVDELFVDKMGEFATWSDGAVGKQVFVTGHDRERNADNSTFTISGVYRHYLISNLQNEDKRPSALFYGEVGNEGYWMPHILFKIRPDALDKARAALDKALEGKEIEIISYEEQMRAAYADSLKMRNTLVLGVILSLLIALLGLVGFTRDESMRRSKEIAVRKINGATTEEVLGLFAWDIMKLSLVMAVVADAAAWFVARKWLEQFAAKVPLSPLFFIVGSLLVLATVLAVVVLNCLGIARENPVNSLRSE